MSDPILVRIRRFIGIKSDEQIEVEVKSEPKVRRASKALEKTDGIIRELEALERRHR